MKQKIFANTILIKYFFSFSKLVKSEPYLAILLFYDVNVMATVAKKIKFFFYKNFFPSPFLSRAV